MQHDISMGDRRGEKGAVLPRLVAVRMDGPGQALTDMLRYIAACCGCKIKRGVQLLHRAGANLKFVNIIGAVLFVAVRANDLDLVLLIRLKAQSSLRLGDAEASQYADKGRKDR